jgi:hypothetical protein
MLLLIIPLDFYRTIQTLCRDNPLEDTQLTERAKLQLFKLMYRRTKMTKLRRSMKINGKSLKKVGLNVMLTQVLFKMSKEEVGEQSFEIITAE